DGEALRLPFHDGREREAARALEDSDRMLGLARADLLVDEDELVPKEVGSEVEERPGREPRHGLDALFRHEGRGAVEGLALPARCRRAKDRRERSLKEPARRDEVAEAAVPHLAHNSERLDRVRGAGEEVAASEELLGCCLPRRGKDDGLAALLFAQRALRLVE